MLLNALLGDYPVTSALKRGMRSSMDRSVSRQVLELLEQSRQRAGNPEMNPFGVEANRRNLEVAIDCVYGQRMIPQRFNVDELFA